jgi:hypothetical protein
MPANNSLLKSLKKTKSQVVVEENNFGRRNTVNFSQSKMQFLSMLKSYEVRQQATPSKIPSKGNSLQNNDSPALRSSSTLQKR